MVPVQASGGLFARAGSNDSPKKQRVFFPAVGTHPLFGIYVLPLLCPLYCEWLIRKSEEHAATSGGWTKNRHRGYPTTDLRAQDVPGVSTWVELSLWPAIEKEVTNRYGLPPGACCLNDAFIVKYAASGQNRLDTHRDGCLLSGSITLNSEFEGGGLFIHELGEKLTVNAGDLVLHCGKWLHKALPVTQGVRFVLVFFIGLDLTKCTFVDVEMTKQCCGTRSELDDVTLIKILWDERKWQEMQWSANFPDREGGVVEGQGVGATGEQSSLSRARCFGPNGVT
jgi:hypothetical protein